MCKQAACTEADGMKLPSPYEHKNRMARLALSCHGRRRQVAADCTAAASPRQGNAVLAFLQRSRCARAGGRRRGAVWAGVRERHLRHVEAAKN